MSLQINTAQKLHQFKAEKLLSLKNFDGKKSLYFISNTIIDSRVKLSSQCTLGSLEKKIKEFEGLLKDQKEKAELLKRELKNR